jgi:hypothetical protein
MSELYTYVFGEPCIGVAEAGFSARYQLTDRRIAEALAAARTLVPPECVIGAQAYQERAMPFVFAT